MEKKDLSGVENGAFDAAVEDEHPSLDIKEKTEQEEAEDEAAAARGAWGGQLEFILTCVGYAVGLGNVWRFPYLCFKNGGGAFLIPYIIMLIFVGMPIFYFELAFGQFASLGPISIWSAAPIAKGIGYGMVAVSALIGCYYCIIIAWAFYYFFASMTDVLPWSDCLQTWNDQRCVTAEDLKNLTADEALLNKTLLERNMTSKIQFETPSEQFYYNEMLKMSDGIDDIGAPVWELALCLLLVWTIVFFALIKGISSLGKVIYVVTIFPYMMMTVLLIRGVTLPGAAEGIKYYLEPDLNKLANIEAWSDAATQIFFSLSACSGGLIAMSSYSKFNNNCFRDALIVPVINCFTSVYSGFAIFSVLGYMAYEKGVDVQDVADSGPGLVFVVYPEALSQMPAPMVWSILFFLMLIMLGFSSEFSIVETVFVAIMDEFPHLLRSTPWRPIIFRGCCCIFFFLIGLPMVCNFLVIESAPHGCYYCIITVCIGYGMVAVSALIGCYYCIIIAWAFYYFFASMTDVLPWSDCLQTWNDQRCVTAEDLKNLTADEALLNKTLLERNMTSKIQFETPSEQFYYNEMLKMSDGIDDIGAPVWELALCLLLVWTIVFFALIKGISSLGKVIYVVTIFPYMMMTVLLIRGVTLPGAAEGIKYYLEPDLNKLANIEAWSDAATQIFFSLSACSGGLIAMSSYSKFNNNCFRDALIVPVINCFTSVYSGFAIFSVLGYMAYEKGVDVQDVADSGPGLVFVVYPEALSQMPAPMVWSILFFLMLIMLGFSSEFSIVETVFVAIMDEFPHLLRSTPWRPIIFRGCCCIFFFLIGLPMVCNGGFYLFTLVDHFTGGYPLLFVGFFELASIQWMYGWRRFSDDVAMMLGRPPVIVYTVLWAIISPFILFLIIILKAYQHEPLSVDKYLYPDWAQGLGWCIVVFTVVWMPVNAIYQLVTTGKQATKPSSSWGPALSENKTGRYAPEAAGNENVGYVINGDAHLGGRDSSVSFSSTKNLVTIEAKSDLPTHNDNYGNYSSNRF